ncbi:MAG: baseplate J/gp47 family protein [Candidatus Kerfeldbacteria bacterium]|nr:baseplate J/gp47 family protein [Candidatus Kerfeldbacteria bacterium]
MKETQIKKRIIVHTPKKHKAASRIEQHYTKIVSIFVLLSVLLIACILYFSFTKTTITITSNVRTVEGSFEIALSEIAGKVYFVDATGSATGQDFNSTTQRPSKATGTVTIHNEYSQAQRLIATTRLLSTEGILFRTQESITVPAGSTIDVPVIADQEGASGNISASRFEIVALWDGLKDKIYGTSAESMTGGLISTSTIAQTDVDAVTTEAKTQFDAEAQAHFTDELSSRTDLPTNVAYSSITPVLPLTITPSAEVGSTANDLTVTVAGSAAIAAYDSTLLVSTLSEKISNSIPEGYELAQSLNTDDIATTVTLHATDGSDAEVHVAIPYSITLSESNEKLASKHLVNMTESKVKFYLLAIPDVSTVSVQFSPFWLKVTPSLEDHIQVKIAK